MLQNTIYTTGIDMKIDFSVTKKDTKVDIYEQLSIYTEGICTHNHGSEGTFLRRALMRSPVKYFDS